MNQRINIGSSGLQFREQSQFHVRLASDHPQRTIIFDWLVHNTEYGVIETGAHWSHFLLNALELIELTTFLKETKNVHDQELQNQETVKGSPEKQRID